jgi:hypothetical protein
VALGDCKAVGASPVDFVARLHREGEFCGVVSGRLGLQRVESVPPPARLRVAVLGCDDLLPTENKVRPPHLHAKVPRAEVVGRGA